MDTNDWKKFNQIIKKNETTILKELLTSLKLEAQLASAEEGKFQTLYHKSLRHRIETQQKLEKVLMELHTREKNEQNNTL